MKITCDAAEFAQSCVNVSRAVAAKSTLPALEGILIKAFGEGVELTCYNTELGIRTTQGCAVEEEGAVVVNAHLFCEILRRLPDGPAEITADSRCYVTIAAGESRFSLMGIPAEDFPELPSVTGGFAITLQQSLLKEMVRQTIFAVAVKGDKAVHTGIQFTVEDNNLRMVAVDGVRLAVRQEPISYEGELLSFVVPARTLSEIIKLTDDDDSFISLSVGKRQIVFELAGYTFISRLLEGDFLDYRTTLPKEYTVTARVNTRRMLEALERTSLMGTADAKLRSPSTCVLSEKGIFLSSSTAIGTASDRFEAMIDGNPLEIGFNNKFLIDALRATDTDECVLRFHTPITPILIKPAEGEGYLYLVLPVRLRTE
ncbi:MAG: DNA polymerase III subunit beta [Oscillospiraceae bacterium]|jgi:DNA polymerase-3 subunit beta|nr:DNA polymerase III subunit beta [Oscillospiraceae bacterium]